MPQRILCLWFPNWSIQRLQQASAELRGRIVLLENVPAKSTVAKANVVEACSRAAWQIGIRPGMPLAEAKVLAAARPVTIEADNEVADRRALEKLACQCQSFSPLVGLEESDRPHSLLLEIAGSSRLFGGERQLLQQLVARLSREKYVFSAAVADNIGVAWAAAHYFPAGLQSPARRRESPALARSSPRPIIVPPQTVEPLRPLPVMALRLPADTVDLLHQLGICAIGQLLQLPRSSLSSRFGYEILKRIDQILGNVEEPIHVCHPPRNLRAAWALEYPTTDRVLLTHVVSLLVQQIAQQLNECDCGAILLHCRFKIVDQQPLQIRAGLYQPSARAAHLSELLGVHLESLTVTGPIEEVEVSVPIWGRLMHAQYELFDDDPHTAVEQLAVLVNRLSSRLGEEAVLRAELQAHAEPERAYRQFTLTGKSSPLVRASGAKKRRVSTSPGKPLDNQKHLAGKRGRSTTRPLPRPLLLYRVPRPVEVVCVAPDGPPQCLWQHGQRWQIAAHWGPERIETSWWRGATLRRDYYRIETDRGCRHWVFRCRRSGRWFLHGEFV